MKTFKIEVFWSYGATIEVEAESIDEAILKAENLDLPKNGEYIEDSYEVDTILTYDLHEENYE